MKISQDGKLVSVIRRSGITFSGQWMSGCISLIMMIGRMSSRKFLIHITVKPRRLQVFFVDADGAKVSFPMPISANIKSKEAKERLIQERFTLKSGRYNREQEYFLVIADQDDETKEFHRYKFEIDISDMSY